MKVKASLMQEHFIEIHKVFPNNKVGYYSNRSHTYYEEDDDVI